MTREEEYYKFCNEIQYKTFQHEGFPDIEDAIEWADSHPVCPWHKINSSEDLPKEEFNDGYHCVFIAIRVDEDSYLFRTDYIKDGHWALNREYEDKNQITHWMEIPEF